MKKLTLLAVGAHPDDIEFGCGAIIARETAAGAKALFVICSKGEAASHGTPAQREAEATEGARLLGATVTFLDFGGDAHIAETLPHTLLLARLIRSHRPDIVLIPTLVENQHPDHPRVARMTRDASRLARYGGVTELQDLTPHAVHHVLHYAITPDAEPRQAEPVLFDVSAPTVMDAWKAALSAHASQHATRDYRDLQLSRALVYGLRCGASHAIPLWPAEPLVFGSLAQLDRSARRF